MAQFKLVILTPHLTEPETENPSVNYYRDIITDFNSQLSFKYGTEQEDIFNINTSQFYNYTYDETLTTNQNMQEILSFKMVKNLFNHKTNSWEDNLYVKKIKNGTLIELIDNYNRSHWFTVNNISYTIKPNNTEISYSAISFFQSQMSKRETAYEIVNDPSSESFIGARNFQFWVEKILSECKTGYSYIPFEYEIFLRKNGDYCAKKDKKFYNLNDLTKAITTPITDLAYLVRKDLSDKKDSSGNIIKKGVDKTITFSLSGGTAENALITLGTEYGLIYEVDYKTKTIWFKEVKNSNYTGLSFSPNTNLQSLSVSQKADSLTTIFNVEGPEIAGEKISLLEAPTPLFLEWFIKPGSGWDESVYYPGLYTDYVATRRGSAADKHFAELAEKVPLLENKIFKSAYIQKVYNPSLYYQIENQIYNKLRINNGKLLCCRNILAQLTKEKVEFIGKYLEPACDTQGTLLYNHCFNKGEAPTDATFSDLPNFNAIKLDEVITYYGNLYRESLQTFAKNLYELRKYWKKLNKTWPTDNPAEIYQLTQYWNNMYLAALKCDYAVQKELPENLPAVLDSLPNIHIDEVASNTYKIYTYNTSISTENTEDWMSTFCNELEVSKYNKNHWHITLIEGREQVYYIIEGLNTSDDHAPRWKDKLTIKYGQGWYQNFIRGYLTHCSNQFESIYTQYSELIKTNQNIWADLYKNYGMLLLESSFTSSTATSSEELYNEAITYYAEYEKPQKQYSLTIIDLQVVHGYQQPLISIGDQIALQYNDFYQEEDDLKDLLEERLFINSISYTLRKDTDITYNVSTVSFYDKLLTKLAKLIH